MSAAPSNQEEPLEVIQAPYKDAPRSVLVSAVSGTVCPIGSQALSVFPPPPLRPLEKCRRKTIVTLCTSSISLSGGLVVVRLASTYIFSSI